MGRRKKPTLLKLVENSRDRRPRGLAKGEPVPGGEVEAPPWLTDDQRAIWDFTVRNAPLGLLKGVDTTLLIAWVVAADVHRQAAIRLANSPLLIRDRNQNILSSPYERIVRQQSVVLKSLAAELGFSPAARTSIAVQGPEDEDDDNTARFFR
jgi:P27 family predicted phage terminase small subunit